MISTYQIFYVLSAYIKMKQIVAKFFHMVFMFSEYKQTEDSTRMRGYPATRTETV